MIKSDSIIVFKESLIKRYWAEYILNHEIYSRIPHIPGLSSIYIIVRNDGGGPPHAKLLYHGSVYSLYILKIRSTSILAVDKIYRRYYMSILLVRKYRIL